MDLRAARMVAGLERPLTKAELVVLRGLAAGETYVSLGAALFLSPESVRARAGRATRKLGARTRTEAVAVAVRNGLIK